MTQWSMGGSDRTQQSSYYAASRENRKDGGTIKRHQSVPYGIATPSSYGANCLLVSSFCAVNDALGIDANMQGTRSQNGNYSTNEAWKNTTVSTQTRHGRFELHTTSQDPSRSKKIGGKTSLFDFQVRPRHL